MNILQITLKNWHCFIIVMILRYHSELFGDLVMSVLYRDNIYICEELILT